MCILHRIMFKRVFILLVEARDKRMYDHRNKQERVRWEEDACRSRPTERSVARSYIIFPGPVISDNRLIKEVGLLPVEYAGTEGLGERHAPERSPTVPMSAWLNTARDLCIVRHTESPTLKQQHFQAASPLACSNFFYISLLIFRYFLPPTTLHFPPTPLQFKTQNHIKVDGHNVGSIIAEITIDLKWICCKASWSKPGEREMF